MMNDDSTVRQLRAALPAWRDDDVPRDLWPEMMRRMSEAPMRFGWLEAALSGAVLAGLAAFPELLPMLLFHV